MSQVEPVDEKDDENDKPRRKLKLVKKTKAALKKKAKITARLKGYFYVFRPMQPEEFSTEVHKIKVDPDAPANTPVKPEETYIVTNDSCSCPAGSNNIPCKHVDMVQGQFRGNEFFREDAEDIIEEYLDDARDKGSKTAVIGELAFGDRGKIKRADSVLFSTERCVAELIMFQEYKGLLMRVTCVPDEELYRRRLSEARIAWSNKKKLI